MANMSNLQRRRQQHMHTNDKSWSGMLTWVSEAEIDQAVLEKMRIWVVYNDDENDRQMTTFDQDLKNLTAEHSSQKGISAIFLFHHHYTYDPFFSCRPLSLKDFAVELHTPGANIK